MHTFNAFNAQRGGVRNKKDTRKKEKASLACEIAAVSKKFQLALEDALIADEDLERHFPDLELESTKNKIEEWIQHLERLELKRRLHNPK
jgi:hypothetical protein